LLDERREIALARAGDVDAFETLVRAHADAVYGFLVRWLQDRELARDVFQEATLRCYRSVHRLDVDAPFRPWLLRIAINRAKTLAARSRARGTIELPSSVEASVPSGENRVEAAATLERVLAELSPADRQILLLRFVEGLSMREVGNVLRVPEVVAKMRLSRARRRFRETHARVVQEWRDG